MFSTPYGRRLSLRCLKSQCCRITEYPVQLSDHLVDMFPADHIGWQEAQDRVIGAVDDDAVLQHLVDYGLGQVCGIQFRTGHESQYAHVTHASVTILQCA